MEKVKLDNKRILFNLLPAHVAQHFLMSNPRNMVRVQRQRVSGSAGFQLPKHTRLNTLPGCEVTPWPRSC